MDAVSDGGGVAEVFSACSSVQLHSGNVHANAKIPNLSTAKDVSDAA